MGRIAIIPGSAKKLAVLALTVFALAAAPGISWAQEGGGCDDDDDPDDMSNFKKIIGPGGAITYEYQGVVRICGKVPKPNVITILLNKEIEYEWESLRKDFLPKIRNSVEKAPF